MHVSGTYLRALIWFIVGVSTSGCSSFEKESDKKNLDGVVKSYRKDGTLKAEIMYSNKKKNGIAKSYYKDGKVRQKIEYVKGVLLCKDKYREASECSYDPYCHLNG